MAAARELDLAASEQIITCVDLEAGLQAVVAIDNTVLGPGLGGVRYRPYASLEAATVEAQRLASAMTWKNAVAGVPYGGAKSVIMELGQPPHGRERMMRRFGEYVSKLQGVYIPGVDMGTVPDDLSIMASVGVDVSAASEDPSPWTARGVFNAIGAGVAYEFGAATLDDVRVLVQGVGHVGSALARLLRDAGAIVSIADVDSARARAVAERVGAHIVDPDDAFSTKCDVYAPCATARAVTAANVDTLRTRVIAGGANDTLDALECAWLLKDLGVLYVPDFVANAGGVIRVHAIRAGWSDDQTARAVDEIGPRVTELARAADLSGQTMLEAAIDFARLRLAAQEVGAPLA
ncbi:Glu/Leu/Phe/Val dehydrogenase dimerization domain-containing protein [Kribbella sp. NPDC050124]|uniref:Glu/Leu/Phe/Val dehydrogenase dimerization domain-containing protein n=1 Tax=Kribbella sp. NPDC050124 TaxID=3364114 RepID=UPI0037AB366D